jgi:hypothetical protein
MALFRRPKTPFIRPWSRRLSTQAFDWATFMSADFFGARQQGKCRAPFSGENWVKVNSDLEQPGTVASLRLYLLFLLSLLFPHPSGGNYRDKR